MFCSSTSLPALFLMISSNIWLDRVLVWIMFIKYSPPVGVTRDTGPRLETYRIVVGAGNGATQCSQTWTGGFDFQVTLFPFVYISGALWETSHREVTYERVRVLMVLGHLSLVEKVGNTISHTQPFIARIKHPANTFPSQGPVGGPEIDIERRVCWHCTPAPADELDSSTGKERGQR